jgi:quercetin dioxygenase-like cupin family protein
MSLVSPINDSNFHSLPSLTRALAAAVPDPAVEGVVKPLVLGEFAVAGFLRLTAPALQMHRQPNHEELIFILEGEADLRVGDEHRNVRAGDFIFVPRNAVHGVTAITAEPFSLLSVFAPQFNLATDVVYEDDTAAPPRYQII